MRNERLRVERLVSLCQDSPSEYRQPAEGCVPNRTFTGQVSFLGLHWPEPNLGHLPMLNCAWNLLVQEPF